MKIDTYQGDTTVSATERKFGYVSGTSGGGYFFTWLPTLAATLESIEPDSEDMPQRLTRAGVTRAVRSAWREQSRKGWGSLIPAA